MSTAPSLPVRESAESTALLLLARGYWPTVVHPGEKRPIGDGWGLSRKTADELRLLHERYLGAGVGVCLGPDRAPDGGWLIDLEGDGPMAADSLAKLFDGEIVETTGWSSVRGSHNLFVAAEDFLDRMMNAGATEGRGHGKSGVWKLAEYPDLEFRIGGCFPDGRTKQVHSACPPTPGTDGNPRQWNGVKTLARLPKAASDNLRKLAEAKPPRVEPKPEPVVIPMRLPADDGRRGDPVKRASAWLDKAGPSISGENGHGQALFVACRLAHGFGLGVDGARPLYQDWNRTCRPPWSPSELEHKLSEVAGVDHDKPLGHMLDEDRPGWNPPPRSTASVEAKSDPQVVVAEDELEAVKVVDRWPKANPEMFRGVAGEFVQRIAPETEADPVATLFQVVAGFGNMIGRGPHFVVGSTKHYCVLDVAIVGATAVGRKGSSGDDAKFLLKNVDAQWATSRCRRGLSTGEGLTQNVRDPKYRSPTKDELRKGAHPDDLVLEDEGVSDKRLHVVETEMGKLLKVMNRDSNTLSEVLRQTWDGEDLGNLSKNSGCTATAPHITVVGHVTKADITKCLTETDMSNGFANRFLWVMARRSKELPDGGNMFDLDLGDLYERARQAREFAVSLGDRRMTFDAEFRKVWRDIYHELSSDQRHVVASRSEAYVKRLACALALLDATDVVGVAHLKTAVAMWDYVDESIRFVFGAAVKDPNEAKLIEALKAAPDGLTRKEINHDVFGRHLKAKAIGDVLSNLWTRGVVHSKTESAGRGRPAERWFIGRAPTQPQPS